MDLVQDAKKYANVQKEKSVILSMVHVTKNAIVRTMAPATKSLEPVYVFPAGEDIPVNGFARMVTMVLIVMKNVKKLMKVKLHTFIFLLYL